MTFSHVYKVHMKHKQISYFDLGFIPKSSHCIYANILNSEILWSQLFQKRDTQLTIININSFLYDGCVWAFIGPFYVFKCKIKTF